MRAEEAQDPKGCEGKPGIPAAICPRCGYDLSAATFGWSEACPLGGRCSECGLEFGWSEIFRPNAMPRRWIEGARGFREMAIAVVLLPLVSLAANWLFRRIRLGQEGRPRRLWVCLLLPVLLIHVFGVVSSVASLFRVPGNDQFAPLSAIGAMGNPAERTTGRHLANLVVALPQAAFPIGEMVWLPYCDARGTAFSFYPWTGTLRPPAPSPSYVGPGWAAWAAGTEYLGALLSRGFLFLLLAATLVMPICSALTFAALPVSRTRAKVKAIHIVRCGAAAVAATTALLPILAVLALVLERFRFLGYVNPAAVLPAAGLGFVVLWWHRAIRDYLRIPHSFAVAFAIVTVGALGAPVVMLVVGMATRAIGAR